jgi:hypothetical protein
MKEYNYNGIRYKRDNNGQWQYYHPDYKTWIYTQYNNPSVNGTPVYESGELERLFKAKDPYLKETTTQKVEQEAAANKKAQDRVNTINNPLLSTQQKINHFSKNAPTVENANTVKELQAQKKVEDEKARKAAELEKQELDRQELLRNVGSDNTRVNLNKDAYTKIPTMQEQMQAWETFTKNQKDMANRIVMRGDAAKYYPEIRDYYLSKENSHRPGGPLSMEEIILERMRKNPNFLQDLEERKYKDFQKREQQTWDEMPWYMKGINTINALATDPITTLERGLLEFERPLAFQGLESTDPGEFGEDARFYDRALHRDENTVNNLLNYVNPFRAASSLGQNLSQGDYSDAAIDAVSIIPMIKGAKAGWKGMNALMKVNPTKLAGYANSNLISNASPLVQSISNKATVGNLLTGYGGYHAVTENFPNAFDAYSSGDWKTGNKEMFMGVLGAAPLAYEIHANKVIPKTINATKGLYNDVATGNSIVPYAWKSPANNLSSEQSVEMFNNILNSSDFTNAEKALIREYQYSSFPFTKAGAKQDEFNALIQKASTKFPQNTVLTRKFYGERPEGAFQGVKGEPGKYTEFSIQDRPSAFSAGKGSDANWGKDRVVMSGRNVKKVEGNFVKNAYEPVPDEYYANLPEESLTVRDNSQFLKEGDYPFSKSVGDNYYGTSRLTPEQLNAQAETLYQERVKFMSNPENTDWMKPKPGKVESYVKDGKSLEEAEAIVAEQNARYESQMELYGDPANKEKALEAIKNENKVSFSNRPGISDERELMGSGFDMKVVGRVKNELGGTDYIVQPRNIRSLKKEPNSRALSLESGASESQIAAGEGNLNMMLKQMEQNAQGPFSDLEIAKKFNDAENFTKERLILSADEKRKLLREQPDKIVTKYKDIWSNDDSMAEHHNLFPFTREGQQQAFDEGTSFAKKWMFKDSDKFDELNTAYHQGNEKLTNLKVKSAQLENTLQRAMKGYGEADGNLYVDPEVREKAIAEFIKRDPSRQRFDIKDRNGMYDSEYVKILVEQNPNDPKLIGIGNIQRQLEATNAEFQQLRPEVSENLRLINENIDPQFRNKVAQIYDMSLKENEMMPDLSFSQAEIHMGNIDDQSKLVQFGKYEPSYRNLNATDQKYLEDNLFKIEGVNRAGDSSMDGNIITLGSRPQTVDDQAFFKIVSNSGDLGQDPEYVRFVGSFMKDPLEVAMTNVHEVAGHQGQKMFGNWMGKLQKYDPEFVYDIPVDDNYLAKLFKEALVEPVKGVKSIDDKGAVETFKTHDTWLSSPQELYADLMIARYDYAKRLMAAFDITLDEAIARIKDPANMDRNSEWFANHPHVAPHFKNGTSMDLKKQLIKYLPAVVIGGGYGLSQGMNSDTPQNKYGGNIEKLSKFIRK